MPHRTDDTSPATVSVRRDHDPKRGQPGRSVGVAAVLVALTLLITLGIVGVASDDDGPVEDMTDELSADRAVVDREVVDWRRVEAPAGSLRLESLVATPGGFAMLAGPSGPGATLWSSPDGVTWSASDLAVTPFGLTTAGADLVIFREYRSVRLGWDGARWVERATTDLPTYARAGYQSNRPALVHTDAGVLLHSVEGELFFSADGEHFELVVERGQWWNPGDDVWKRFTGPSVHDACEPPAQGTLDYPPVLSTPAGFVAFVPLEKLGPNLTWPVCEPQLWFSADGAVWSPLTADSTFEPSSYVYDVAGAAGRYIAVGGRGDGEPALWRSDDGRSWSALDSLPNGDRYVLTDITMGEAGYLILGQATTGREQRAWFSRDGSCWTRLPEDVRGLAAAVGTERIVLADRGTAPALWVGSIDPHLGANCDITNGP